MISRVRPEIDVETKNMNPGATMVCDEAIRGLSKKVATPLDPSPLAGECKISQKGTESKRCWYWGQRSNWFLGVSIFVSAF